MAPEDDCGISDDCGNSVKGDIRDDCNDCGISDGICICDDRWPLAHHRLPRGCRAIPISDYYGISDDFGISDDSCPLAHPRISRDPALPQGIYCRLSCLLPLSPFSSNDPRLPADVA
jgi:hypothetical protein